MTQVSEFEDQFFLIEWKSYWINLLIPIESLPYRCPQAVVKMGTSQPLDVQSLRASKKVLVTGPILKKNDMQKFKRFLNDEAGKSGAVDRVDVESLPDTFLLPELKGDDKVAVIASVLFKGATGESS